MKKTLIIFILFLGSFIAKAQPTMGTGYIIEENNPENMILFNGRVYQSPNFNHGNHPFLDANIWAKGSITIDNEAFNSISLKYDIIDDLIVMNLSLSSSSLAIQPHVERVNGFSLGERNFTRLHKNELPEILSGFYEINCSGEFTLYTKYRKADPKNYISSDLWTTTEEFFLRHEDHISKINKRSDLQNFFAPDYEILEYIQQQHFPVKIRNSELLIQLCNHLNSCFTEK